MIQVNLRKLSLADDRVKEATDLAKDFRARTWCDGLGNITDTRKPVHVTGTDRQVSVVLYGPRSIVPLVP